MGLFHRIFSAEFRRGIAEEAAGNFIGAARCYALCGELHKVVEMHLAQARVEREAEDRIREYRLALRFADEDMRLRVMVLRLLGGEMWERGRELGLSTAEGRRMQAEAAAALEQGESFEQAGDCYMELGERQRAAAAYARGGLLERVEQVLGEEDRLRERQRAVHELFDEYEGNLAAGRRDAAAEALRACVEASDYKGEYRRLLSELEERLLTGGRIELRAGQDRVMVVGRYPVLLGRDADCDLQVRGSSVSRVHTRLRLQGDEVVLEDAGSRNGTFLAGQRLGGPLPVPGEGVLGLGSDCTVGLRRLGAARFRLEVQRGLEPGRAAVVGQGPFELPELLPEAPALRLSFARGRPMVRAASRTLLLGGNLCGGEIQLMRGDVVELDGRRLEVE